MRFIPLIPFKLTVSQKGLKQEDLKPFKLSIKGGNRELFHVILLRNLKNLKDNEKTFIRFMETSSQKEVLTSKIENVIRNKITILKDKSVKLENITLLKKANKLEDNKKVVNFSDINELKVGEITFLLWGNIKTSLPIAEKLKKVSYLKSYEKHLPNQRLENLVSPQMGEDKKVEIKKLVLKNAFTKGESISLDKDKNSNNNTQALSFFDSADRFYEHIRNLKKVFALKKITKIDAENQNTKVFSIKIPLEETILQIRMIKDNFYAKILTSNDRVNIIMQNLNQLTQQIANLGFSKTVVSVQSSSGSSFKQDNQRSNRDDNKHNNNGEKLERGTENSNLISFSFYL